MKKYTDILPASVRVVRNLSEVFNTAFDAEHNAVVHRRELEGDFDGLARALAEWPDLRLRHMKALAKSPDNPHATETWWIVKDMQRLEKAGFSPVLRVRTAGGYGLYDGRVHPAFWSVRSESLSEYSFAAQAEDFVQSTVQLFHGDLPGGTKNERILACYNAPATEGLGLGESRPLLEQKRALEKVEAVFRKKNPGAFDREQYDEWRKLEYDDLRAPLKGARPFAFRAGDVFRFATQGNTNVTEPFAHRAPRIPQGSAPRLLLVGEPKA